MTQAHPERPELLIVAPMTPFVMQALEHDYTTHRLWEQADRAAYLREHGAGIRGVATNGGVGLKPEIMAALPALEMVAIYGVGLDAIDLNEAARRGLSVSTTPDVLTNDVADQGLALLLAAARRISYGDRYVRAGQWAQHGEMPLTTRLGGKRAGIVGLGRVGQALARRLLALDMQVLYTDRAELPGLPYQFFPDILSLAREVDVLIVAAAGGEGTRKLVDAGVLAALGSDGLLINISRGTIVDEEALVAALQRGELGGAGLDVFAAEPTVPPALLEMDNVVLAPHAASGTRESRHEMGELVLANLKAHFAGQTLPTPVRLPEPTR
ncbi:2-hydroxyacid dehydrogenase (plasmid) [Deinococcus sp. KNUC1210]|uniref:2-hydroxyacid dehydrogenase n=1 Tax=Deinococcus sp. KNUC1210 TaxID=2917691 RepID=UPI001EF0CF76|nr:2-hydroxyacid dehydrogenase [Deinococcus sp. KNUC1210]ULH14230.1 2-hydroxyacid dehydrogenase [Deinococcus sp. KNUC1210]